MGGWQIAMVAWLVLFQWGSLQRLIKWAGDREAPGTAAVTALIFLPLPYWFLFEGGFFS